MHCWHSVSAGRGGGGWQGTVLYLVPLRFLHLLGLPLRGEDQGGPEGGDGALADGLLGVPHRVEDVVEEGLHLLEEEGGCADGQLPQHQHLEGAQRRGFRNTQRVLTEHRVLTQHHSGYTLSQHADPWFWRRGNVAAL